MDVRSSPAAAFVETRSTDVRMRTRLTGPTLVVAGTRRRDMLEWGAWAGRR